jgi:uncharacterized YigZ family protein
MAEEVKYFTIAESGEGFYKEKGSKFYGFSYPVNSDEGIKGKLEDLRKKYFDARHHCYAFRIGLEQPTIRANDDGEPNHSAGDPILGQIRSMNLTNVLVVVIRYFGGTKLGVGGLINAYKTAAFEALKAVKIVEVIPTVNFSIKYGYEETPAVERLIKELELFDIERVFEEQCELHAGIRPTIKNSFEKLVSDLQLSYEWKVD